MLARRRGFCRRTLLLLISALLFSQWALANYGCPAEAASSMTQRMAQGLAQDMPHEMAAGTPCESMDEVQPALCHQYVVDSGQVAQGAEPLAASPPTSVQVLLMPSAPDSHAAGAMPRARTREAQPPPEPVFLATLRLRV
jgi:hypothetical protein